MNRDTIATHVYAAMLSSQQSGMTGDRLVSLAGLAVRAADILAAELARPAGAAMMPPASTAGLQVAGVGAGGPQPVIPANQGWVPVGGVGGLPTGGAPLVQSQGWEPVSPQGAAGLGQPIAAKMPLPPPPAEEALR